MSIVCARPCPIAHEHRFHLAGLRNHLAEGHRCTDAWVALSHLLHETWQRLECLERAHTIDTEDLTLRIAYLEHKLALNPGDAEIAAELREARARRVIETYRPRIFRQQDATIPIGTIMSALSIVSDEDIKVALEEQDRFRRMGHRVMLGDLLVARGKVAPQALARALTLQCRIRAANSAQPHSLGEFLISHGSLTPEQLESALAEQIHLRLSGKNEPLGEILLRRGDVDVPTLQSALVQQIQDSMAAFV